MDIICKVKYNTIFWRNSHDEEWHNAPLDQMIEIYQNEPYCELNYWTTVHPEDNEEKELYHLFECDNCGKVVAALDKNHDYAYCPYCGSAILEVHDNDR